MRCVGVVVRDDKDRADGTKFAVLTGFYRLDPGLGNRFPAGTKPGTAARNCVFFQSARFILSPDTSNLADF